MDGFVDRWIGGSVEGHGFFERFPGVRRRGILLVRESAGRSCGVCKLLFPALSSLGKRRGRFFGGVVTQGSSFRATLGYVLSSFQDFKVGSLREEGMEDWKAGVGRS
jgi:hypothetical protein